MKISINLIKILSPEVDSVLFAQVVNTAFFVSSYTAFDLAIAIAYMMFEEQSPEVLPSVDVGGHVLRGTGPSKAIVKNFFIEL